MEDGRILQFICEEKTNNVVTNTNTFYLSLKDLKDGAIVFHDVIKNQKLKDFEYQLSIVSISEEKVIIKELILSNDELERTYSLSPHQINLTVSYIKGINTEMQILIKLGYDEFGKIIFNERTLNDVLKDLIELHGSFDSPKFSYQDKDYLEELKQIIEQNETFPTEKIEDLCMACIVISMAYLDMGRMYLVGEYLTKAFKYVVNNINENKEVIRDFSSPQTVLFFASIVIKARNHYHDDDCEDIFENCSIILNQNLEGLVNKKSILEEARNHLIYDEIEETDAYLNVIDEIEASIDNCNDDLTELKKWQLKANLLEKKGIIWNSPKVLNPTQFE